MLKIFEDGYLKKGAKDDDNLAWLEMDVAVGSLYSGVANREGVGIPVPVKKIHFFFTSPQKGSPIDSFFITILATLVL